MDASESPPPDSFRPSAPNSTHSSQNHHAAAAAPFQASPDTNTDADTDTPDILTTTTSINHLRNNSSTLAPPYQYQQQQGIHRPVRRVSSTEGPRLGAAQGSLGIHEALKKRPCQSAPARVQQSQQSQQQPQHQQRETSPLSPAPTPLAPRFYFAQFWNPQRLFSVVRPTSPLPQPPSPSSTGSPSIHPLQLPSTATATSGEGGGRTTPTPASSSISTSTSKTVSKSLSTSSMRLLVAQHEARGQSSRRSSLSVKPVSATTTVSLGESSSVSELSMRRQQDPSSSQSREALASVSAKFIKLPIQRRGSIHSDLGSDSSCTIGVHRSGRSPSACYPSPTSPNTPSISTALDCAQKRVSQGQTQLLQYTNMIQKHDADRTEYMALQAGNQKERATLEREIEVMENAIRQYSSRPMSPLSSFFSSASAAAGSFWSHSSPPSQSRYGDDCHTQAACCPFKAAAALASADTTSSSSLSPNVTPITAFPRRSSTGTQHSSALSSSPSMSRYSSSAPLPIPADVPRPSRSRSTSSLHLCYTAPSRTLPVSSSSPILSSFHSGHQPQRKPHSSPSTQSRLPPSPLQPLAAIPSASTSPSRASAAESTLPSPLSPPPSMSRPSAPQLKPLTMCRRCCLKTTLKAQQEQLRALQRRIDQVQQKIHSTTSQIRHLQRTFVLPIEACLKEDLENLERVWQLEVGGGDGGGGFQCQKERQNHQ